MIFNVPILEKTQSYIFWGSLIGFFVEDIPQLIIVQVCKFYIVYLNYKIKLILHLFY